MGRLELNFLAGAGYPMFSVGNRQVADESRGGG